MSFIPKPLTAHQFWFAVAASGFQGLSMLGDSFPDAHWCKAAAFGAKVMAMMLLTAVTWLTNPTQPPPAA